MKQKFVKLINGKSIADEILSDLKLQISKLKNPPGIAAILIGDDPASKLYIKNKEKQSQKIGINFHKYLCNNDCCKYITEKEILKMIKFLNEDPKIHGIIVQLPLPTKFNTEKIISAINPKKDADGFQPENLKNYLSGKTKNIPPLAAAILAIINSENLQTAGRRITAITHSKIFGPVIKKALTDLGAKVQLISETDPALKQKTSQADILISIVGKPEFITADFIKPDAVLIDVGITLTKDGFKGDVNFESVKNKATLITPTPGGVGPVTVAMLLKNVCELAKN